MLLAAMPPMFENMRHPRLRVPLACRQCEVPQCHACRLTCKQPEGQGCLLPTTIENCAATVVNLDQATPVDIEGDFAMHKRLRTVQILKKRTDTLRTLIRRNASEYQILKAAVKLREARIRVVHAQIGEMPSVLTTPEQTRRVAKLVKEIESLESTPPLDFVAKLRASLDTGA
jgi:hypothetical protein